MKNNKRIVMNELSIGIVNYLHKTFKDSYKQIGEKIGLSKSFISRVRHRERNLTLDSLVKIERAYNIPLPAILLQAIKDKNIPKNLRPLYKAGRDLLKSAMKLYEV